jgi:hypothetical protein
MFLGLEVSLFMGGAKTNIRSNGKLKKVAQELALSSKPVSTEIFLKKNRESN